MHNPCQSCWRGLFPLVCFLGVSPLQSIASPIARCDEQQPGQPVLVDSRRIWNKARHNTFTDLLQYRDRWYCVFREGTAHVSPAGALRVIVSQDGDKWESLALVESSEYDLRDAKLTVTPNDELMLNGAGMIADADIRYYSMTWFSSDAGKTRDKGRMIGDPGFWLWRAQWNKDVAYSFGYSTERELARSGNCACIAQPTAASLKRTSNSSPRQRVAVRTEFCS